ncbi:MAG: hypothetical protein M3379_20785, partial [Acidobacteriota bacterium]|nr:hypothetical protein [Acidobacteriota bacterium]
AGMTMERDVDISSENSLGAVSDGEPQTPVGERVRPRGLSSNIAQPRAGVPAPAARCGGCSVLSLKQVESHRRRRSSTLRAQV